jgi:lipoprotein-releasing system permease protein
MILSFRLAVRFLRSGRLQTVLIIGGISIAIAVQLFVGLLIGSLQKGFVDRTLGSSADITVESAVRGAPLSQDRDTLVTALRQVDGVEAVSVVASGNAFVEGNIAARLRGFVLEDVDQIYNLSDSIVQGNMPSALGEVIIGDKLREELQIDVGDTIMVTTLEEAETPVVVSGIYDLGVAQINGSWVISDLETIQEIFGFGEAITAVEVGVDDVFRADAIAEAIAVELGDPDISVSNWKDDNEELFEALRSQHAGRHGTSKVPADRHSQGDGHQGSVGQSHLSVSGVPAGVGGVGYRDRHRDGNAVCLCECRQRRIRFAPD